MKKIACVDIGTNSVRMIILEENCRDCIEAEKHMETTRIGRGVDQSKLLSEAGMSDTLNALKTFSDIAKEAEVEGIYAIATSAVRDAGNREVFLEAVRKETGMSVEMISGEEEARLGFLGVSKGVAQSGLVKEDDYILVVDIGGGSTELIVGKSGNIEYAVSLDIGAVRLHDKFVISDPMELNEQQDMSDFIRIHIKEALHEIQQFNIKAVIGIGGTITTAGSMALEMENYDRKKIHNYYVPLDIIHNKNRKLLSQTLEERKLMKGLQPKRADIIPCGFMILQQLLLGLEKIGISISEYDNLEGLYFEKI